MQCHPEVILKTLRIEMCMMTFDTWDLFNCMDLGGYPSLISWAEPSSSPGREKEREL